MPEYFTLLELRALPQLGDAARYTNERCEAAAAWAVGVIEREVGGVPFIYRTVTDELHDGGRLEVVLDEPYAQNTGVLSVTENGAAVTATMRIRSGVLRKLGAAGIPLAWSSGLENIAVTYQHGYSSVPPGDVKEAALQLTRERLLETDSDAFTDARTVELVNELGGTSRRGEVDEDHPTGIPTIDSVIVGYRRKLDVFGFA